VRRAALAPALLVLPVALVLLLAGCGGSTSLSDKQLRARATVLCATAARRAGRIPTPKSADHSVPFLNRGIAALKPELAGLRSLRPSDDLSDVYETSVRAFSQKLEALEKTVRKLHSGEDPVVAWKTLQQRLGPLESAEDAGWRALQVPACLNG
jgi:hypothetical protein